MSSEVSEKQPVVETVIPKSVVKIHRQVQSDNVIYYCKIKKNNVFLSSYVYLSPTGDCQTFSISAVNNFLPSFNEPNLDLEILARCFQVTGKNQLLVNICTDTKTMTRFKEIFDGYIILEQNYKSTRDSAMTMFLVKTIPLLKWLEENNKKGKITYEDDKI